MYNFLLNLVLYQIVPRHYKQDYLIVLDAGLINGKKVSRLLGSRIDRAIAFSNKQYDKGHKRPKLIMSGVKGKMKIYQKQKQWKIMQLNAAMIQT